ncbi:MAG: hypothetical protein IJ298_09765 [Ruminococcus sp.]|nr:hypothetical protein [Ruminococcus sp.]
MNSEKRRSIDEMLKVYGSRKAPYTFRFKGEEKVMTTKRRFRPALAVSCIACLLVCAVLGVGIFAGDLFLPSESKGAVISVSAAQGEDVAVGTQRTALCRENAPLIRLSKAPSELYEDGFTAMSYSSLGFKISGEDIVSYDIKSQKGTLEYVDFKAYEEHKVNGADTEYLYFDSSFENMKPFDESDPYRFVIGWWPEFDRFNSDLRDFTGGVDRNTKNPTEEQMLSMGQAYDSLLKTAEDFTSYFGDTVTVTLHYSDGTTEVLNIEITLDENGYAYGEYEKVNEDVVVYG